MMNLGRQPADKIACADQSRFAARKLRWWKGWDLLVILQVFAVVFVPRHGPRWTFMWTLAVAIYCGCKWLTWRRTPLHEKTLSGSLCYLLAWPGLDAAPFINTFRFPVKLRPTAANGYLPRPICVGLWLFFWLARRVAVHSVYWAGWVGMVGIIMTLHFGLFHIVSCGWRSMA